MLSLAATLRFVFKRAWYRRAILLPVALGALGVITLLASAPLFTSTATSTALQKLLHAPGPLLSHNLEIIYPARPMTDNIYGSTNEYVTDSIPQNLGSALAPSPPLRAGETGSLLFYQPGAAHTQQMPLGSTILWFSSSMNSGHLKLLQGRFPSPQLLGVTSTPRGYVYDVEAIIAPEWAAEYHLKLNDVIEVADSDALDPNRRYTHQQFKPLLRVQIVGIFQPKSLQDPAWFDDLEPFTPPLGDNGLPPMPLWVNQATFTGRVPLILPGANFSYLWFYYLHLDAITPDNAAMVVANLHSVIAYEFPTQHDAVFTSLPDLLQNFLQQLVFVDVVTLVAILPGVALLLLYLLLAAAVLVEQSREELALMQSRGASQWQMLAFSLGEALLLCLTALLIAPFLAEQIANGLTQLSSPGTAPGHISLVLMLPSPQSYLYAAGATLLCFLAILLPAIGTLRTSLLTIKRRTSRPRLLSLPLRLGPGLLLTALGLYGYLEIQQRGAFFLQNLQGTASVDWVAASAPTLLLLGAAGLSLLLLPPALALLDRLAQRLPVSVGLASRNLARRSGRYSRLVFLLTLTISLGVFAALCYGTLNTNLDDRAAFLAGADLRLVEGNFSLPDLERQAAPLADHLHLLPGVTDGMNVLRVHTSLAYAGSTAGATLLAVDTARFARIAYWRSDFADASLDALLQTIRVTPAQGGTLPAIVSDQLLSQTSLHIGDQFFINLATTQETLFPLRIVGTFHYFPTIDPSEYGVISDLNRLVGALNQSELAPVAPNEVWLKLAPNAPAYTAEQVEQIFFSNSQRQRVVVDIQQAYDRAALAESLHAEPLQSIIFGTLILDLLIAALLSVAGLVLFLYLIARQRTFEFGVLRVLGLSLRQLAGTLGWEELTLFAAVLLLGVPLGVGIATLTLPALAFDESGQPLFPPVVLRLNEQQALQEGLILCTCLLAALVMTALLFRRLRVQEVLRLGEE